MRIAQLRISNILGIDELEFDAGQFNEVSGPNGAGKTSVLEAVKAALGTGHDATLLRKGAEQGEVVLVLDDGTSIRRRVKTGASDTQVKRDGKLVNKPGTTIASLIDALAVNPVDFLRATKKDRARVLLESMPIKADRNRLHKISGLDVINTDERHGLEVIDATHAAVYEARTVTNRAVKDREATIEQLQAAMPELPGGVEGDEDQLRAQLQNEIDAINAENQRITTKLGKLEQDAQGKVLAIREKLAADIQALRNAAATEEQAVNAEMERTRGLAAAQRTKSNDDSVARQQPLRDAINAIASNRDAAAKRRVTQETIATMEAEAQQLRETAARQTAALDQINAYKAELLAGLPIPGLEVVGGEILRYGVAFDRLNTAQQVQIAVEIAKLRAGSLRVVCVDGIELLNSQSYEAFKAQAIEAGLQMFVSRVTDDEGMSVHVSE